LETHWPEVLSQVVLPLHVPQLTPQVGSGPQKRPVHAGTQFAAAEAFMTAVAACSMEGSLAEGSAPSTQPNTQRLDVIRNAGISSRKVLMSWISIQGIDSSWIAGRPAWRVSLALVRRAIAPAMPTPNTRKSGPIERSPAGELLPVAIRVRLSDISPGGQTSLERASSFYERLEHRTVRFPQRF
jgi:hypothetical protein